MSNKTLDELYPRHVANLIKTESNRITPCGELISMFEKEFLTVVGVTAHGAIMYELTELGSTKLGEIQKSLVG